MSEVYGTLDDTAAPVPVGKGGSYTLLDEFRESAAEEITNVVCFPIEHRKGDWIAEFNAVIGQPEIKRYRNEAMGKKKRLEDADDIIVCGMALVEKNTALYKGAATAENMLVDSDGDPLTFRSEEFLAMFPNEPKAVRKLARFLGDAQVTSMGQALYRASGYGEDLQPMDPIGG